MKQETIRSWLAFAAACFLSLTACERQVPIVVGAKPFTSNIIIAHMFAELLEAKGFPVERRIPFGNSFACQQALRHGELDLYPEYTATGWGMIGLDPRGATNDWQDLQQRFLELGMRWLPRLGAEDPFVVVVGTHWAQRHGISTISQLAQFKGPIRIASSQEFLERPVDGWWPLKSYYGIDEARVIVFDGEQSQLYRSLRKRNVEAMIAFNSDPQIDDVTLRRLVDDRQFFRPYLVAPLMAESAARRSPGAETQLAQLANQLSSSQLRSLSQRVEIEGMNPMLIAYRFLADRGLTAARSTPGVKRTIAIATHESRRDLQGTQRALQALRRGLKSPVKLQPGSDPLHELNAFHSSLAILGAEELFSLDKAGVKRRPPGVDTIAVIGHQVVHLVTIAKGTGAALPTRLAVGPEGGSSEHIAKILVSAYQQNTQLITGPWEEAAQQLKLAKVGGVLRVSFSQDPFVTNLLSQPFIALSSLPDWHLAGRSVRFPFLRRALLTNHDYPSQDSSVETLYTQLIVAAPRRISKSLGRGSQAAGTDQRIRLISAEQRKRIRSELGTEEGIDPTLLDPSSLDDGAGRARRVVSPTSLNPNPLGSFASAMVILGLAWLISSLFRADKQAR